MTHCQSAEVGIPTLLSSAHYLCHRRLSRRRLWSMAGEPYPVSERAIEASIFIEFVEDGDPFVDFRIQLTNHVAAAGHEVELAPVRPGFEPSGQQVFIA